MATTTTIKMTCQICGCLHKARIDKKSGKLEMVHHGYKLPWAGGKTAPCKGTNEQPYEQSCEYVKTRIREVQNDIAFNNAKMQDMLNNPPATLVVYEYAGAWKPAKKTEYARPDEFTFDPAKGVNWYGHKSYAAAFFETFDNLRRSNEAMLAYTVTLQMRVNNWKAAE